MGLTLGPNLFAASIPFLARVEISNYVKGTSIVSYDFGRTSCNFEFASGFIFMGNFLLYNLLFWKS